MCSLCDDHHLIEPIHFILLLCSPAPAHSGSHRQPKGAPRSSSLQTKEPPADRSVSSVSSSQPALCSAEGLLPLHAPRPRLQPGTLRRHTSKTRRTGQKLMSGPPPPAVQRRRPPDLVVGRRAHPALLQAPDGLDGDHAVLGRPAPGLLRAAARRSEPSHRLCLSRTVCAATILQVRDGLRRRLLHPLLSCSWAATLCWNCFGVKSIHSLHLSKSTETCGKNTPNILHVLKSI